MVVSVCGEITLSVFATATPPRVTPIQGTCEWAELFRGGEKLTAGLSPIRTSLVLRDGKYSRGTGPPVTVALRDPSAPAQSEAACPAGGVPAFFARLPSGIVVVFGFNCPHISLGFGHRHRLSLLSTPH